MNNKTWTVSFTGFSSKEIAESFLDWYIEVGEQNAGIWFECRNYEDSLYPDSVNSIVESKKLDEEKREFSISGANGILSLYGEDSQGRKFLYKDTRPGKMKSSFLMS